MQTFHGLIRCVFCVLLLTGCGGDSKQGLSEAGTTCEENVDCEAGLSCIQEVCVGSNDTTNPKMGPVCEGHGWNEAAEPYSGDCLGLTACTDFFAPPKGITSGCYCSKCSPKPSAGIVCMDITCIPPSG